MKICKLKINAIKVGSTRRDLDYHVVNELAKSILEVGLISPIVVDQNKKLIAGNHRLHAFKQLAKSTKKYTLIPAFVVTSSKLSSELMELEENLIRSELTPLQKAVQLYRRQQIYDQLNNSEAFSAFMSRKVGESQRSIQRYLFVGKWLSPIEKKIEGTLLANSLGELLKLASLKSHDRIMEVIQVIDNGTVTTVKEALAVLVMNEDTQLYGYPVIRDNSKNTSTVQLNFQLLPSQKRFVENALRQASRHKLILPVKAKDTNANNLVKICDFYVRNHP